VQEVWASTRNSHRCVFALGEGARLKDSEFNAKSDFACFSRFYPGLEVGVR